MASASFTVNQYAPVTGRGTVALGHQPRHADRVIARIGHQRRPSLIVRTVEAEIDEDVEHLPFGVRMAIILGCGMLGWAVPIAIAWSLFG